MNTNETRDKHGRFSPKAPIPPLIQTGSSDEAVGLTVPDNINLTSLIGKRILAMIVVIGCFILIGLGHDGVINSVLIAVVAFYFGVKSTPPVE